MSETCASCRRPAAWELAPCSDCGGMCCEDCMDAGRCEWCRDAKARIEADIDRLIRDASRTTEPPDVVREIPIAAIRLDPERFQFKGGCDDGGIVPGERLEGQYVRIGTAPILLWEDDDGALYVVNGHHRFDLAKRTGERSIPAQTVRGMNAATARRMGAEINIRDGTGSTLDYARFFRDMEEGPWIKTTLEDDVRLRGLLARAKGRNGWAVGRMSSGPLWDQFVNGGVPERHAVALAKAAPNDERRQVAGIAYLMRGKRTPDQVAAFVSALGTTRKEGKVKDGDFFGFDDSAIREAEILAATVAKVQSDIAAHIRSAQAAARAPEKAGSLGVKVKDPKNTLERIAELKAEAERWENWATSGVVDTARRMAGLPPLEEEPEEPDFDEPAPKIMKQDFVPFTPRGPMPRNQRDFALVAQPPTLETGKNPSAHPRTPDMFARERLLRRPSMGAIA